MNASCSSIARRLLAACLGAAFLVGCTLQADLTGPLATVHLSSKKGDAGAEDSGTGGGTSSSGGSSTDASAPGDGGSAPDDCYWTQGHWECSGSDAGVTVDGGPSSSSGWGGSSGSSGMAEDGGPLNGDEDAGAYGG